MRRCRTRRFSAAALRQDGVATEMACAHAASSSSSAPSSRAAISFPARIATRTASAAARCSGTSAATSARATPGARGSPTCGPRPQNRAYDGRRLARQRGDQQLQRQGQDVGRRRRAEVGARRQRDATRNFKLQGEYFRLRQDGSLTYDDSGQAVPQFGAPSPTPSRATSRAGMGKACGSSCRAGAWAIAMTGCATGRSTTASSTNGLGPTAADFSLLANHSPTRNTLMLDFSPTEFSRLRLQLARDESRLGAHRQPGLPAVHPQPRPARRAQVLSCDATWRRTCIAS